MRRAIPWFIGILIILGGVTYWYLAMRPEPGTDRQQILRLIADVERAVEQSDAAGIMRYISENYEDPNGLNRRAVRRMVLAGTRQRRPLTLSVDVTDISVQGDFATFTAEVAYTLGAQALPSEGRHLTVSAELIREDGRWKVVSAEGWQQAGSDFM